MTASQLKVGNIFLYDGKEYRVKRALVTDEAEEDYNSEFVLGVSIVPHDHTVLVLHPDDEVVLVQES